MKYKISKKRATFLQERFFEFSFKGLDLDTETLDLISEPIELDFIAKHYNYDDGNEALLHIVNNPNCDLSTVKMIFFRADLDSFLNNKQDSDDLELIQAIINNCKAGLYKYENFYYNPLHDTEILEVGIEKLKHFFPDILFGNPKGRALEPNFAESFFKRNINTSKVEVEIQKNVASLNVVSKDFTFKYIVNTDFQTTDDSEIDRFIESFEFPQNLQKDFYVTAQQLKKVIIKPVLVISNNDFINLLFIFNSQPLLLEDSLTNVATILRNEFVHIQAFFQITAVEENFETIKRIKHGGSWFALSKSMKIKIANIECEKYLKLLLSEKNGILFYFLIISDAIEHLKDEVIQHSIINNIMIH